jgi:hypothetical protein
MPPIARMRTSCSTCLLPASNCTCNTCYACRARVYREDFCSTCNCCRSNGCCCCVSCTNASCTVHGPRVANRLVGFGSICNRCSACKAHCVCYTCRTCQLVIPINQRRTPALERKVWCDNCHNCVSHCRCYRCCEPILVDGDVRPSQCEVTGGITTICINCAKCEAHCHCSTCITCLKKIDVHGSCGACIYCCVCNTRGVKFRSGNFTFHNSQFGLGEFKRNKLRRHLSVELEVDKYDYEARSSKVNMAINRWCDPVVRDGSIGDDGFEITTNPTNGDKFIQHMQEISEGLKPLRAKCSERCGLHVHVNVKGEVLKDKEGNFILDEQGNFTFDKRTAYTQLDLRRLIRLYEKIEPAIFSLCTDQRITSRYGTICGAYWAGLKQDTDKFRKDLISKMYFENNSILHQSPAKVKNQYATFANLGSVIKNKKMHKYEKCRYKALNIHTYFIRGTIEFRHHQGTVDGNEIINWSLVCGNIVEAAYKMTDSQVSELPDDPFKALLSILPKDLRNWCIEVWEKFNKDGWNRYSQILQDNFPKINTIERRNT